MDTQENGQPQKTYFRKKGSGLRRRRLVQEVGVSKEVNTSKQALTVNNNDEFGKQQLRRFNKIKLPQVAQWQRMRLPEQGPPEAQAQPLGQEDALEGRMAKPSSILAWKFYEEKSLMGCSPWGHKQLDTTEHECNTDKGGP